MLKVLMAAVLIPLAGYTSIQSLPLPTSWDASESDSTRLPIPIRQYTKIVRADTAEIVGTPTPSGGCRYDSGPMQNSPEGKWVEEGKILSMETCTFRVIRTLRVDPSKSVQPNRKTSGNSLFGI